MLTVIGITGEVNKRGNRIYRVQCECGVIRTISSDKLYKEKTGRGTRSCGCLVKHSRGEAAKYQLFMSYVKRSSDKGFGFNLTQSEFIDLVSQPCHYCGVPPSNRVKKAAFNGDFLYSGLDRIDSTKGYTHGNVVPCCRACNYAKSTMSQSEFRDLVIRIYEYWARGESWH